MKKKELKTKVKELEGIIVEHEHVAALQRKCIRRLRAGMKRNNIPYVAKSWLDFEELEEV